MFLSTFNLLLLAETLNSGACLTTCRRFPVTGVGLFGTSNSVGTAFHISLSCLEFINCESSKCLLHSRKVLFSTSTLLQSRSERRVLTLHFLHLFSQNKTITAYN